VEVFNSFPKWGLRDQKRKFVFADNKILLMMRSGGNSVAPSKTIHNEDVAQYRCLLRKIYLHIVNICILFAFGLSAKLMPKALELFDSFFTTFLQFVGNFLQLFDNFLTILCQLWQILTTFDNFSTTFQQLFTIFSKPFDIFLTIFWQLFDNVFFYFLTQCNTITHLCHHKSSLDPQMTAEGTVGAPTCFYLYIVYCL
jgi:hypothetical protein